MNNFKTSYILAKHEMLFLLSSIQGVPPSCPAQYLLNRYLSDSVFSQDAVEGLVYKKLARKASGKIVLEPVVDLFVRAVMSSDIVLIAEREDIESSIFILRSRDLYIHIKRYPHISGSWKVTPYQNKDTLLNEFDNANFTKVIRVDNNGEQQSENADAIKSWIEDGVE